MADQSTESAYKQISKETGGRDMAISVSVSALVEMLDHHNHRKQQWIDLIIEKIQDVKRREALKELANEC